MLLSPQTELFDCSAAPRLQVKWQRCMWLYPDTNALQKDTIPYFAIHGSFRLFTRKWTFWINFNFCLKCDTITAYTCAYLPIQATPCAYIWQSRMQFMRVHIVSCPCTLRYNSVLPYSLGYNYKAMTLYPIQSHPSVLGIYVSVMDKRYLAVKTNRKFDFKLGISLIKKDMFFSYSFSKASSIVSMFIRQQFFFH